MNYQLILEVVLAVITTAAIIVGAVYMVKYSVLSNTAVGVVIAIIEKYLGAILTSPQEQQFYTLLVDAIEDAISAATPGTSQADIITAIAVLINTGIADLGWPPINPALLSEIITLVMILVNAIGVAKFTTLMKEKVI